MKGQVFTIAKLHYVNGVTYLTARMGNSDLDTLAKNDGLTTKSGSVQHPEKRVRDLVRFAEGLGLLQLNKEGGTSITDLGSEYSKARSDEWWDISNDQKTLLRDHILSNPRGTKTIHAIVSLLRLVEDGHSGKVLSEKYAIAIEKEDAWQSEVTYEGFTGFGLSYLKELGFIDEQSEVSISASRTKKQRRPKREPKSFLFTWNPKKFDWSYLPQAVFETNTEGQHIEIWSCNASNQISPGDRAFLMRLGESPKGIMGSGVVLSHPFLEDHGDSERADRGERAYQVEIQFDVLRDLPILDDKLLSIGVLGQYNWFPHSSGTRIPKDISKRLESLWLKMTKVALPSKKTTAAPPGRREGSSRKLQITAYERNPDARRECLEHHGYTCRVCSLDFEEYYGPIGKGFIHVHHIVPISQVGEQYEVCPEKDLLPVCPNCHAMLHTQVPPYCVNDLKKIIGNQC